MEEFLFDLRGFVVISQALEADHLKKINDWIDVLPPLEREEWLGNMEVHTYGDIDGLNLQNIIEGGELFERMIDHPAWIDLVRYYLGSLTEPFINECFLNLRGRGGYIGVHSGGWKTDGRIRSGVQGGTWCVQYLSLIVALNDIGPGDGASVVIPGSHKSSFQHPQQTEGVGITHRPGEEIEGTEEIHLRAGDVALFNDMLIHGSAARTNEGHRRTLVFRYLPTIYAHRLGYEPSPELLQRLTPERHKIVQPIVPHRPPRNRPLA